MSRGAFGPDAFDDYSSPKSRRAPRRPPRRPTPDESDVTVRMIMAAEVARDAHLVAQYLRKAVTDALPTRSAIVPSYILECVAELLEKVQA